MVNVTIKEYDQLLSFVRLKLNRNYIHYLEDIVQDLLIEKDNISQCYTEYVSVIKRYNVPILEYDSKKYISENVCIKCGSLKPAMVFRIYKANNIIYLGNICSDCRREENYKYYLNNKDKFAGYSRKYRIKNGERKNNATKMWKANNKQKIIDYRKAYYQKKIKKKRLNTKKKIEGMEKQKWKILNKKITSRTRIIYLEFFSLIWILKIERSKKRG